MESVVRLNASLRRAQTEKEEKIQEIFDLKENLVEKEEIVKAAEDQLVEDQKILRDKDASIKSVTASFFKMRQKILYFFSQCF